MGNELQQVSLLPGPVEISAAVRRAFCRAPIPHRSDAFRILAGEVREKLRELSGGMEAALFSGSGTLANDVVGAAIKADRRRNSGLILSNGEFGERLAVHASRWCLPHDVLRWNWGCAWDPEAITAHLDRHPHTNWVWAVQMETSTGMTNRAAQLAGLAASRGIAVYLDCVSGFGACGSLMDLGLRNTELATAVSGKSLGACSGVAIVLASESAMNELHSEAFPPSLDLPDALRTGTLTTFPSNALAALREALRGQGPDTWRRYNTMGNFVRLQLRAIGVEVLVEGTDAAPVISTLRFTSREARASFLQASQSAGFAVASDSEYLRKRDYLQIATMGAVTIQHLTRLFDELRMKKSLNLL